MENLLQNIDWFALLSAIWTIVLVPIGKEIYEWLKLKKLDEYALILYDEVLKAVKSVYETEVKDIKGTDGWTQEKMEEVKEIAKDKVIYAIPSIAYRCLKEANEDFEEYLDGLIGTALYDLKNGLNKEGENG